MQHWPQVLSALSIAGTIVGHAFGAGIKRDPYHFSSGVIMASVTTFVLYEGGYWAVWGWAP